MKIRFRQKGDFRKTENFLKNLKNKRFLQKLDRYGQMGVEALSAATPVDSGTTASSWYYKITQTDYMTTVTWSNSNVNKGVNIAIILQYGHSTGTGGYVEGRDYINPAMKPIFDELAEKMWKEVEAL